MNERESRNEEREESNERRDINEREDIREREESRESRESVQAKKKESRRGLKESARQTPKKEVKRKRPCDKMCLMYGKTKKKNVFD